MGTLRTFVLLIAAFVGTVMFITDPSQKLINWLRGKKTSELIVEYNRFIENIEPVELIAKGCGFVFFILLSYLYTFVIQPLAVISALINKIGYQPIAYAILLIIALDWIQTVRVFTGKKTSKPQGIIVTTEGEKVEGKVIETDEEIKIGHPAWIFMRRVFLSLPTFYLWYLFLVVIGALNF
jgi:hypothetical protein